jgi:hypothetical protein
MSTDKPSKNEDEYFARAEAERLKLMREQEAASRVARERHSHFMKCPKCGATLQTEALQGIQVDRCPECHGIWLDHDEIATLMKHQDHGTLGRVMSDLWSSLRGRSTS